MKPTPTSDQQRRLVMLREEGYIVRMSGTVYLAPGRQGPAWTVVAPDGRTVHGLRSLEEALACAEEDVLGHNS